MIDNPMQHMLRDIHALRGTGDEQQRKVSHMFGRFNLDPNSAISEPG
jgi:hypothetical protein